MELYSVQDITSDVMIYTLKMKKTSFGELELAKEVQNILNSNEDRCGYQVVGEELPTVHISRVGHRVEDCKNLIFKPIEV